MKKNHKKILIVLLSCWTKEGGIQQVNKSVLKFFSDSHFYSDMDVLILYDEQKDIDLALKTKPYLQGLNMKGYSGRKGNFSVAFLKQVLLKQYDFIWFDHINLAPFMTFISILAVPYAMSIHGFEVWHSINVIKKIGLCKAKHIVCPSNYTMTRASQHAFVFKKAAFCPWGLDIHYSPDSYELSAESIFHKRKTVLITGRMDKNEGYSKGHQELIKAVCLLKNEFPEVLLIIVGQGSAQSLFQKMVCEMNIEEYVMFTGFVPDEQLHTYYTGCDVFAMPSYGEGFGLVYLEAMAHGKPCIGSNADAAREVIIDGETGFCVDPANTRLLADRLAYLLTNEEAKKRMGEAGRKRYLENFTEKHFYERLRGIITI